MTINYSVNVQDAIHYRRLAVDPDFPAVKVVRPLLDINRLQAILNVVLFVGEPALRKEKAGSKLTMTCFKTIFPLHTTEA